MHPSVEEPRHIIDVILAYEGVENRLFAVIPAKAGIPKHLKPLDSCLRRNDGKVEILHLSTPSQAGIPRHKGLG